MKTKYALIALLLILVYGGCRRNNSMEPDLSNVQLITAAKDWYSKQMVANQSSNSLFKVPTRTVPLWNDFEISKTGDGEYLIFVRTPGRKITNTEIGSISALVFSYHKGGLITGEMTEVIGDAEVLKQQKLSFVKRFNDARIPELSQAVFIISDMSFKIRHSYTVIKGIVDKSVRTSIQQFGSSGFSEVYGAGKKISLINDGVLSSKLKVATTSTDNCDAVLFVVYEIGTGKIISVSFLYYTCETNGDDGGEGGEYPDGGDPGQVPDEYNDPNQLPPNVPVDLKDPCVEKGIINKNQSDATMKSIKAKILANSTVSEYGANINVSSLSSTTFMDTPVTTDGSSNSFTPGFSWNSTSGYTVGWSHGHPGGSAPSPDDVFVMIDNLTNAELISAGAQAIKYYRDHVSASVVTNDRNYVVTVKDWGKLQTLFETFKDDPGGFDDQFTDLSTAYYENNHMGGVGPAGVYALTKLFGDAINIYVANKNSETFYPVDFTPLNYMTNKGCP